MSLENLLLEKRSVIINKWRDLIFSSYPADTQRFLKKEKNRFSNPVGQNVSENLEVLYDEIIRGGDADKIGDCLDQIIRVRAIQDLKPSQAVSFLPSLKNLIRDECVRGKDANGIFNEMEAIEERIEKAMFMAFDIYTRCREKLFEIRVNETRNQVERLLKRANLVVEIPDENDCI